MIALVFGAGVLGLTLRPFLTIGVSLAVLAGMHPISDLICHLNGWSRA